MPLIINPTQTPTALLHKARLEVADKGDKVFLTIGNSTKVMDYATALQLSQWLRVHAKKAKKTAGDMSRHWSAIGVVEGLKT